MASRKVWENTPSELTEFGPLSSDVKPSSGIFSWFFKKNKDASDHSPSSSPTGSQVSSRETSVERSERSEPTRIQQKKIEVNPTSPETEEDSISVSEDTDTQSQHSVSSDGSIASQRRTLTNVLSRLSSILDRGSSKESDFKQYWMPDSSCRECYDCGDKFTTLRRRHHCRICGQIFCSKCCNQELPGKIMGYRGGVRVCAYCCRVVTNYAQQQGSSAGDLRFSKEDLKNLYPIDGGESIASAGSNIGSQDSGWWTPVLKKRYTNSLREEQAHHYRSHSSPDITNGVPTKASAPFDISHQTEFSSVENITNESRILTQNSSQLRELWRQIQHPIDGVEMQSHRFRLKTYQQCVTGKELVEWLIKKGKAVKRLQAVAIGQALIYATYLEPICQQLTPFQDDYTLYKPGEAANNLGQNIPTELLPCLRPNLEPNWLKEIDEDSDQDESLSLPEDQRSSISTSSTKSQQQQTSNSTFYVKSNHFDQGHGMVDSRRSKLDQNTGIDKSFPDSVDFDPSPSCSKDLPDDFLTGTLLVSKSGNTVEPFVCTQGWRSSEGLHWENGESLAFERLSKVHSEHLSTLVCQLLTQEGLSLSWENTIMQTTNMITKLVSPDVRNEGDDMDIRKYVQIKKIPGGQRNQTAVVNGVVCSKNVAHKKMQQTIANPKILLLKGAIDYQRVENKFSSLEPLILQEREFLKNSVAKVCSLKPDVVVVEKSVCRLAQEFLLEAGITLVFHTKTSVMQRISRSTQAEIVHSIDGLVNKPTLGFCLLFQVKNFQLPNGDTKTLLYFDGCATHLGCTVTLRGSHSNELKRVKKILQLMNYASYHRQLEVSFIMDEFGLPPPSAEECGFHLNSFDGAEKKGQYGSVEQEEYVPENSDKSIDTDSKREAYKNTSLTLSRQLVEEIGDSAMVDSDAANQDSEQMDTFSDSNTDQMDSNQTCDNKIDKDSKCKHTGIQELTDFSDPLHNYQNTEDDSIFQSSVALQEQKVAQQQKIRKALEGLVLSVSPYIKIDPPYLESTNGLKSSLRKYFPDEMYFSPALNETKSIDSRPKCFDTDLVSRLSNRKNVEITEAHPFILSKLVSPVCHNSVQNILSDFRARGGRIKAAADGTCHHDTPKESSKKTKDSEQKNDTNYVSMYYEPKRDCLDLNNHQHLSVLFSSFASTSPNAPNPCVNPWIVTMEFYGKNDVTLGAFLERFCFRESYVCPASPCDTPMVDHVRRFVHENGCITVDLRKLDRRIPGAENNILMWSWCRKCTQVTPVVQMTMDSWSISFAKYLELRFHAHMYKRRASGEPCTHSLHHDHFQYFGYRDIVASFKYSTISLREIALPSIVVDYQHQPYFPKELSREVVSLNNKGMDVYNAILEQTIKLQNEYSQQRNQSKILNDYLTFQKNERARMKKHADEIHEKLETIVKGSQDGKLDKQGVCFALYNEIIDSLTVLKQMVAEAVMNWNAKIQDFAMQKKEKSKSSSSSVRDLPPTPEVSDSLLASTLSSAEGSCYSSRSNSPHRTPQNEVPDLTMLDEMSYVQNSLTEQLAKPVISEPIPINRDEPVHSTPVRSELVEKVTVGKDSLSSGWIEPSTSSPMENEVFPNSQESPGGSGSNKEARGRSTKKELWKYNTEEQVAEEQEKKRTMLSLLPGFRSTSGNFASLKMPFEAHEHPLLSKCERVPIIVYDTEPSSIIAYALSSHDYHNQLQEIQSQLGSMQKESPTPSPEYQQRNKSDASRNYPPKSTDLGLNSSPEQDVNDGSVMPQDDSEKAKQPRKLAINPHIETQFSDSSSRFYCRVHFAEQFRHLRTLIFPAGEDVFIRSLNHCKHWSAKGGKSRSAFSKTCDNRFILKQMSSIEAESFQVFAPNYFQYIKKAYLEQRPTVLAKILGVYTIGFRNTQTNSAMKQDLLVMENLLYNRKVSQTFDLKGSDRNRLVNTSGKQEEEVVLLDQNFLQVSVGSPLYIRPHSKVVLSQAITSDSQFLASNLIMDYSLLVGQDDQRKELVVGIIDYIRTFTWDKKLEMVVKSAGILGGQGKMPTVVFPDLYKSRFLEAMDRYFPPVPDRWSGLGYGLDY